MKPQKENMPYTHFKSKDTQSETVVFTWCWDNAYVSFSFDSLSEFSNFFLNEYILFFILNEKKINISLKREWGHLFLRWASLHKAKLEDILWGCWANNIHWCLGGVWAKEHPAELTKGARAGGKEPGVRRKVKRWGAGAVNEVVKP